MLYIPDSNKPYSLEGIKNNLLITKHGKIKIQIKNNVFDIKYTL
tara:strand:+ start:47 stop:178 length:132 start_codon:yes stop_codon:yes gene_type:complete